MGKLEKKYYPLYLMIPALIIFTIFYIGSIVGGFIFSFTNWNIYNFSNPQFVGLENFKDLFTSTSFMPALWNVVIFAIITTIVKVSLGLLIAILLNNKFKGRNFFRAVSFLPCTIGTLVIGYVFSFILQPETGVLNIILRGIGLESIAMNWLGDPNIALYSVAGVESWIWIGFNVAIILAGLQSIPSELYEAARIDGATRFQKFKEITLPLLRPTINTTITLCVIGGFNVFDIIMSMTNGGPNGATQVISKLSYDAMRTGTMGYASAINVVQLLLILLVITPLLKTLKRREYQ
ncbi:sugar ABC transporter permease [Clostridium sardiniense]|uniref:Sugar ABC transporter permease n=1 Tax=Clostridium sardiniense TaxID=29369 RepID=A0ABS7KU49_CLOSR|nr:sugar ABC transporter permease [Clostridium sardiniense]MBY0754249.1 sugar ABC transporter permease [Clostridium sardiniense]MDQ0461226.1 raffinose/stachyose/melibiose transport system permease protein [Clostridium sardiniense]